jgi:hypothetical protein
MRKYDYFINSMKAKAHYHRGWMLRAFSVVLDEVSSGNIEWALRHTPDRVEVYAKHGDKWGWEELEGVSPYEIPFIYHESSGPVKAGDVENLFADIPDSTWGELLYNSRIIVYAVGDRMPFRVYPIDLGADEKFIVDRMIDDPYLGGSNLSSTDMATSPAVDPKQIYVMHYLRFGKAVGDIAGYEFFVPSVTERSLQAPANHAALRAKELDENKETLNDPVTQAKVQNTLVANYVEEQLKGDPSEGFLYKKKSLNTALKRMFLIHGPESGFSEGGQAKLITNSLEEGLDIDHYPDMVNSLRAGSYYRGALTALAGEDVDLMGRIFQNSRIVDDFCGTKDTLDVTIADTAVGRTIIDAGKAVKVTKENLDQYKGQVYGMFSPMYCLAGANDICKVCIGDKLAAFPNSLGSMVSDIPSKMMAVMMGSAHAKELRTTPLDLDNFLR